MKYKSVEELIGNTPLVELTNIEKKYNLAGKLFVKLEAMNPTGSAKDRAALYMINDAGKAGLLDKDTVIIEPTSGNTGIGLACIGNARGYRVIIVMPDSMSIERIKLMKAYGAEVVLTPGNLGMKGAIEKAEELKNSFPKAFIPDQFNNKSNSKAHYETTGPEIFQDLDGKVDYFIAGIGTGGTISGTGRFLKENIKDVKIIGIEPDTSPLLTKGYAGPHKLQGIGANFIPTVLEQDVIDEVVTATAEEAYEMISILGKEEGLFVGITSGAAAAIAISIAKKPENKGKNIVALLPDSGTRYLSNL